MGVFELMDFVCGDVSTVTFSNLVFSSFFVHDYSFVFFDFDYVFEIMFVMGCVASWHYGEMAHDDVFRVIIWSY